jgi:hypothetical protein
MDSLLYAAYADGRADEREDMRRTLLEMVAALPESAKPAYIDLLRHLARPVK